MNGHHHTRPYYRTFSRSRPVMVMACVVNCLKRRRRESTKRRHTRPEGENERKICEKNIIITSNPHYSRSLEFIYIMIIEPSSNTMTPLVKKPNCIISWLSCLPGFGVILRLKSESKMKPTRLLNDSV